MVVVVFFFFLFYMKSYSFVSNVQNKQRRTRDLHFSLREAAFVSALALSPVGCETSVFCPSVFSLARAHKSDTGALLGGMLLESVVLQAVIQEREVVVECYGSTAGLGR